MEKEILPKDVYLHLAETADDRTILNMLSVNKTYNDPKFFEHVLRKKYPATIPFKPAEMSWKQYYLECIFYIGKLKEEIGYQYTKNAKVSPKKMYNFIIREDHGKKISRETLRYRMHQAANAGKVLDLSHMNVDTFEGIKMIHPPGPGSLKIRYNPNLPIVSNKKNNWDKFIRYFNHYIRILIAAARDGDVDLVDFYINKVQPHQRLSAFTGAVQGNQMDLLEYLMEEYPDVVAWSNILSMFIDEDLEKNEDFSNLEYIINNKPNIILTPAVHKAIHLKYVNTIKYLLTKGADPKEGLFYIDNNLNQGKYSDIIKLLEEHLDYRSHLERLRK